ncbi:hypothetical protein, partial [Streptomyces sp. 8N706]|uniref:hypothetical protein n=1 Tax=Streptomyces sp. 8N706 TaxID=3457416 RepID=UPI003FD4B221
MGWEEIAEELYALPPEVFTAARDEAAGTAPREEAARIRALRRPTLAAWAVNLLVRRERKQIEALLGLGEQLRRAHHELDGRQLRELSHQQRRLVAALSEQARRLTAEAGRPVPESALREVEATVHAALADPEAARELATGRLVKPLAPPAGFGPPADATVHQLRPSGQPDSRDRAAAGRTGRAERKRTGAQGRSDRDDQKDQEGREGLATVADLAARSRERERAERERRARLTEARRDAESLDRAARSSAEQAVAAERGLADA